MNVVGLLTQIRTGWLNRISRKLATGAGVRESFLTQLNQFYDALIQSVEAGDPAWMDPIIQQWVEARPQIEEGVDEASLYPIFSQILSSTQAFIQETLEPNEGMDVLAALLPVFTYAYDQTASLEIQRRVQDFQKELKNARRELERLDKTKSDFISVAAHELKTPLTLIEGYISMIRDLFPKGDETSREIILLKGVDNGTRRLKEIINDMIDISLLDNEMLTLNYQPLWINRLLSTLNEEFKGSISQRRQSLIVNDFPGSGEMTFADPERLYQALRNLLTNAIKYTPDGGKVTIDGRTLPGFIEITVADTGIGIDPDDHIRIFEKFSQLGNISLHSSGKTKFKGGGPGLGLPITKGIIEAHGGTIWVESDCYDEIKYPGSTFHVLLPLRKEPPDDESAKQFSPLFKGKNID